MTEVAKSSFPMGHNRPPRTPSYDGLGDLGHAFITIMIGAFAAVGAMTIGTLF